MANIVREPTRKLCEQDIKRLRQMWDAGIASGSAGEFDMKKLRHEARERLKGATKAAGNAD
jgi:antitoxin ParD1/3/4